MTHFTQITDSAGELAGAFHALREREYPWSGRTAYLDNASIGPLPERTRRVVAGWGVRRADPASITDQELVEVLQAAREAAARLIGAAVEEIGLATNTGFGLNLAAQALPLEAGDRVVLSDREFPGNVYPWLMLERRGVEVVRVPTTPQGWPDEEALTEQVAHPRARVLAISLVQFSNGYAADLGALGEACRAHDAYLVVDAIQALGQLPVDVRRTPVDILACGGQKWLLSPWGSGFVYVRRALLPTVIPPVVGWMAFEGTDDVSRLTTYDGRLRSDARRLETVTLPYQDLAGFTESVSMLLDLGVERIAAYLQRLCAPIREGADAGRFDVVSPGPERGSAIVAVRAENPARVHAALARADVVCAVREGALRFSPHWYNTPDEMARVGEILGNG